MKKKRPFLKQKISLFFDQNFPFEIIESIRNSKSIRRKVRMLSVYELNLSSRDDPCCFEYCKNNGYSLVTLDDDFMNDKKFPFKKIPGIIKIVASHNNVSDIKYLLEIFLDFVAYMPLPKVFLGDSKFQVSSTSCIMRARDAISSQIKTMEIIPNKTTVWEVRKYFSYFI